MDEEEEDELFKKSAEYDQRVIEIEENHKIMVLPSAEALVNALERMEGWDTDAGRELAEKNANKLLEKNQDVKVKREAFTALHTKLKAASKDMKFNLEEKKQMREDLKEKKRIADEAELAAGIFRPDEGKESKAARMREMDVIRAILVSAEAGEKEVAKLDWGGDLVGLPISYGEE